MAKQMTEVLVAGYQALETASADFDALIAQVQAKHLSVEAAILVAHDADGDVSVQQTGDHLGRKGAGWGGAVGLLVGLAAPPLLASVVVGAAGGAIVGRFASHKLETGLHEKLGEAMKPGTAAIIAMFAATSAWSSSGLPDRPPGRGPDRRQGRRARGIARRGDGQVQPRPDGAADPGPGLWRRHRPHHGRVGRRLVLHPRAQGPGGRSERAASCSSTMLGSAAHDLRWRDRDTRAQPRRRRWARRSTPSTSRRSARRRARPCSPGATTIAWAWAASPSSRARSRATPATRPRSCTALPRILKENGYVTAGFGKWHMTPGHEMGAAGSFDHWPLGWGFDHWWGFLTGAAGQYDPIITQDNSTLGVPEGDDGKVYYFPDDITDKAVEWIPCGPGPRDREALDALLLDRLQPRTAPRGQGVGRQVQGRVR